jgi:hypothetical protein
MGSHNWLKTLVENAAAASAAAALAENAGSAAASVQAPEDAALVD